MFCILSCSNVFAEAEVSGNVATDADTPIVWSLAALSDTIRYLYSNHCKTEKDELQVLSDYIYKKKPHATLKEVKYNCINANPSLSRVLFHYNTKNGDCPLDGQTKNGYTQKSGPSVGKISCNYFLRELVNKQNKFVDKYGALALEGMPGLYVKRVGNNVYKVINFVKSSKPNQDDNVVVHILGDDNTNKNDLYRKMYSEDMFVNISTTGKVEGIHNNSYIYTDVDLTDFMLEAARQDGTAFSMLLNSYGLKFGEHYDIKNWFCGTNKNDKWTTKLKSLVKNRQNLRYGSQSVEDCHTNGVIFQGKIVTLEWLGHWLFGQRKAINSGGSRLGQGVYDKFADREQSNTSGHNAGQAQTDGAYNKKVQDMGYNAGMETEVFKYTQVKRPEDAINCVKNYLVNKGMVNDKSDIKSCKTTECKSGLKSAVPAAGAVITGHPVVAGAIVAGTGEQDYVICELKDGRKLQYEFDDICNTLGNRNTSKCGF